MSEDFKPGDEVEWNAHGGKTKPGGKARGRLVRKLTEETQVKGHTAKASDEDPQYLVRSDESGQRAAHRPEALRRKR